MLELSLLATVTKADLVDLVIGRHEFSCSNSSSYLATSACGTQLELVLERIGDMRK